MNEKLKIFYLIDITVLIISFIGAIFVNNYDYGYGLSALEGVGDFVIVGLIFLISLFLLIIVSIIYIITRCIKRNR